MNRRLISWHCIYAFFLLFLCVGSETNLLSACEMSESGLSEISNGRSEEELLAYVACNSLAKEDAEKLFWHAAGKGYLKVVQYLVQERKVDSCASDHEGRTALHKAASGGHVSVICYLMLNGVLFDAVDKEGYTPLLDAAFCDQYKAFLALVENGANPEEKLPDGSNVLHVAVAGNSWSIVSYLFREMTHIVSPYVRDKAGRTPVHNAARLGHLLLLMYFHQQDKRVLGERDAQGMTPLLVALEAKNSSVARYLIDIAWDGILLMQDSRGRTPLHLAAADGLSDLVSHLVEMRGVPVDYKNLLWETPLHLAARAGQLDIVKYLIGKDADPEHMDQEESTPLLSAAQEGKLDAVRYLVEQVGVDLTAENASGGTVLHCATESAGSLPLVKYLVEQRRVLVDTVNTRFETPLGWAVLNNHLEIAEYLIARGACIEEHPGHHAHSAGCLSRPVHLAIAEKEINGVMYLIKRGAKLYSIDFAKAAENGCLTPLIRELMGLLLKGEVNSKPFLDFLKHQAKLPAFGIWLRSGKGAWCALLYTLLVSQFDAASHLFGEQHDQLMRVGAFMHQLLRDIQKRMQKQVTRDVAGIILCDFLCFPKTVFQAPVKYSREGGDWVRSGGTPAGDRKRSREDHESDNGDKGLQQLSAKKAKRV